jgi:hypothetical protein
LDASGVIPVAILTTDSFNANNVRTDTVTFAGAPPIRSATEDVDQDEDADLALHFVTEETNIAAGDSQACLQGETVSGDAFEGCDSIRTVPSHSTDSAVLNYLPLPPLAPILATGVSAAWTGYFRA